MKANLTLLYSKNVYLNLIKNVELKEIDKITQKYNDESEIRKSSEFSNLFSSFYSKYSNYIKSIKDPNNKNGKLCITYLDNNNELDKLNILYKNDLKDSKKEVNAICKKLRDSETPKLLVNMLNKFDFIFASEYNKINYHFNRLKSDIYYLNKPLSSDNLKKYNTLIKIIYDELIKGYDEETQEITENSYYHIRLVASYLEEKLGVKSYNNKVVIVKDNIQKVEKSKLIKNNESIKKKEKKKDYHGMGDYMLEDDREWRR